MQFWLVVLLFALFLPSVSAVLLPNPLFLFLYLQNVYLSVCLCLFVCLLVFYQVIQKD